MSCPTYPCVQPWLKKNGFKYCANAYGVRVASKDTAHGVNTGAHILRQLLDAVDDDKVTAWLRTHYWMPVLNGTSHDAAVQWADTFYPTNYYQFGEGNGGDGCSDVVPGLGYALVTNYANTNPYINLHEAVHIVTHGLAYAYPAQFGHDSYESVVGKAAKEMVAVNLFRPTDDVKEDAMTLIPEFAQRVVEDYLNVMAGRSDMDYNLSFTHSPIANEHLQKGIDAVKQRFNLTTIGHLNGKPFVLANYAACVPQTGNVNDEVPGVQGFMVPLLCHTSLPVVIVLSVVIMIVFSHLCYKKDKTRRPVRYSQVVPQAFV